MNYSVLCLLVLVSACSYKKPDKGSNENHKNQSILQSSESLDTDGDGLLNKEDKAPFIADVPVFTGEMLEEIKVITNFYHRGQDKHFSTELVIKSQDDNAILKKSSSLIKIMGEDATAMTNRNQNNLVLQISEDMVNTYSAPIIAESLAHNFMARSSDLENQGYFLDSVEFEIRNKIKFSSARFSHFRDLILEVYFYDYQSKKLEFIDFYKNQGSFEFNKDHLLDLVNIKTRNTRIMDNSVLKSGKFLYVKVKDFYLPEIKQNYSDLMREVKKKTLPFLVNSPDGVEIYYVGINGGGESFHSLVEKSLQDHFEIDTGAFLKYRDYPVGEYRYDTPEGNRVNVNSKWHVITNEINNNPFSYSFTPKDIILLNYSKSNDPVFMARNVLNSFCDTKRDSILKGEGLTPLKTRKIKIIISSLISEEPYLSVDHYTAEACGGRRCMGGNVTYKKTSVSFKNDFLNSSDPRFQNFLRNTFLEIDGFEYPFSKLLSENKFSLSYDNEGKFILESKDPFITSLHNFGNETVKFSLFHRRDQKHMEIGSYLVDCECWSACGGPAVKVGCQYVSDQGSVTSKATPLNYTFYTSVFIF